MSRTSGVLVVALLALCWAVSAQSSVDCKKISASGKTFDFSALQAATATTPWKINDPSGQWEYEVAVCNNFNCDGAQAAVCQEASNGIHACGVPFAANTPAVWTKKSLYFPKGAVTFTMSPVNDRGSTITVMCDPGARYVSICSQHGAIQCRSSFSIHCSLFDRSSRTLKIPNLSF